ncbi:MAG TPA: redox-sensitive transcriptional activator SoxR [Acidimicrobiia bacterium]|jgi:MerR family redox-sensitive transcriptional activator SoxR|nr:redox-sensitive transcriptional activator SoxR [Acidimicrobiia bacterium]
MSALAEWLTIGELARRGGVATSALRFYESKGLLHAKRTAGNQRRFHRSSLRRIGVIRAAQAVGLPLADVQNALSELPHQRTPTRSDWESISRRWQDDLDRRIAELELLRGKLTGCIGCGCLSLDTCGLFNDDDTAARRGAGARYLLGDEPPAV